jgi:hypothetical protein
MAINATRFLSLVFTALVMAPAFAHLLELPNKINLKANDYLTVQQIYRGWAFLGVPILGALVSTLLLAISVRGRPSAFPFALGAFLCIAGSQVIFWTFTFPANQQTNNWTMLPANWMQLRSQWEYSHAAGATLVFLALIMLTLALMRS